MPQIELSNYCCQVSYKRVNTSRFEGKHLTIAVHGRRQLRFSPLGNNPVAPRIALVGITPGAQSEAFARYLSYLPVEEAAKRAAFKGAQNQIKELLSANGFAAGIGLCLEGDLNDNPDIFTTSLVKCCLMVDGSYKFEAPDIAKSPEAIYCVANRFLADIRRFKTLKWIVIFGDPGWEAVTTLSVDGATVLASFRDRDWKFLTFRTLLGIFSNAQFSVSMKMRRRRILGENRSINRMRREQGTCERPYCLRCGGIQIALTHELCSRHGGKRMASRV